MIRLKRLVVLIASVLLIAAPGFAADESLDRPSTIGCTKVTFTATGDSFWMDARGRSLVVSFEPDITGSATSLTVAVQHCLPESGDPFNTDTCVDYTWLDNAGASSNVLTGVSGARRGFQWAITGGVLRFTVGGSAVGTGKLQVCGS